MASSTIAAGTDHQGSEMVNIRESELHTIPRHVSDFVKKFVTPHVTNDGEKVYPISVNDLRGTNQIFFVKTTSDANQSNCKFMPGPGDMTIRTTKDIKPGDELRKERMGGGGGWQRQGWTSAGTVTGGRSEERGVGKEC